MFNFLDRGIIPGSTEEFNNFITNNLNTNHPDLYIGLLQSSFIIGFCIASPIFASLSHYYGPFQLILYGIIVWTIAVIISGLSYYSNSYILLLFGRVLSGVGESSFQCCIPPWIAINSNEKTKSVWLAIFNTAIPVGTALGYVYSSVISTSIGWQWTFFIESILMLPFLIFLGFIKSRFPYVKPGVRHFIPVNERDEEEIVPVLIPNNDNDNEIIIRLSLNENEQENEATFPLIQKTKEEDIYLDERPPPNIIEEIHTICQYPCYLYICAGYAAQTGALIGLSTFGSAFLMGLGYFDSEVEASSYFGAVVSIAGILGYPLGGLILDFFSTRSKSLRGHTHAELIRATIMMIITSTLGFIIFLSTYWIRSKLLFIFVLFIGCLFLFLCNSAITISILLSVPIEHRALAIAFCSILIHAFGDVPSPLLVGFLKDDLAPGCTGDDDSVSTSDACRDEANGLRFTMLLVSLWFAWCILFFTMSFIHAKRDYRAEKTRRPSLYLDPETNKIEKQK